MWVSGIERYKGKLGLLFQDKDGQCHFGPPEDLRSELPLAASGRLEATVEFAEWRTVKACDYLEAVGLGHLLGGGQRCYEFQTAGGPVVIPGQLLVVALLGATSLMRAPLLSPQGPTALMTAFGGEALHVELTPRRMRKFQIDRSLAVSRMAWVLTHPSGSRAWSSVYFHAISGRLDMTLPAARSKVALRGLQSQGKLWVTALELLTLEPTERAHEFAADFFEPNFCWTLSESKGLGKLEQTTQAANICSPMTDRHWEDVKALLSAHCSWINRKQRSYCIRSRLDTIRLHLFSGISFYQLPVSPGLREASRGLTKKLRRLDIWADVESALQSTI